MSRVGGNGHHVVLWSEATSVNPRYASGTSMMSRNAHLCAMLAPRYSRANMKVDLSDTTTSGNGHDPRAWHAEIRKRPAAIPAFQLQLFDEYGLRFLEPRPQRLSIGAVAQHLIVRTYVKAGGERGRAATVPASSILSQKEKPMRPAATRPRASATLYVAFELGNTEWKLAMTPALELAPRITTMPARDLQVLAVELTRAKQHFGLPAAPRS